ncbi:MAG: 16S rRNA (adenine(1518)-N(6)/adenine(1519)-N(6))-dimethyltransferase RsmA [Candidatus Accumulibacter sp.]|jgi:16S rRNA (adenine1518-N6/adenine1519-N6)-dimethyltransferase|nr:16S rRNA (adenine(1518)-N(6)/adenine(1519)-N(6))-dimethyltransferase RsmA [Accumulibacter sp.]
MSRTFARKRFGQHFLTDRQVIASIVEAISPKPGDCLIEIGPGLGALTRPLLSRAGHLHVVEIDRDIVARLRREWEWGSEKLSIHTGDALDFDFRALAGNGNTPARIVGNLPYNISTPLLFHLERCADCVIDMHFMLQKEVVDRLAARPGTADYGRLSVMFQSRFVIDRLFDVPPESFDPPPRVDSSVVRLIPLPACELKVVNREFFSRLVRAAFSQRRKMLRNTLKGLLDESGFSKLGIEPSARAEELSVDMYARISNALDVFPESFCASGFGKRDEK